MPLPSESLQDPSNKLRRVIILLSPVRIVYTDALVLLPNLPLEPSFALTTALKDYTIRQPHTFSGIRGWLRIRRESGHPSTEPS